MTKEKMTIHKALTELSIIDDRIDKALLQLCPVIVKKHAATKVNGVDLNEFDENANSAYQKVTDLIKRRNALKRAVVLSNAKTIVKINGVDYTVAEAIDMKNNGIEHDVQLMNRLSGAYASCESTCQEQNSSNLERRADAFITSIYGNKESANNEEANKAREDFIASNSFEIHDPLDVRKKIDALEESTNAFMTEVDSALSVSNALTEIEIEY